MSKKFNFYFLFFSCLINGYFKQNLCFLAGRLERPSAPIFVRSNHHSIEVEWEHVRIQDETRPRHRRIFDETGLAQPGSLIYLHQREKRTGSIWESIYT
jgi:hypothetical protein